MTGKEVHAWKPWGGGGTHLILALGRERQAHCWVRGYPDLHSEFQDSQGYTEKFCLEKRIKMKKRKKRKKKKGEKLGRSDPIGSGMAEHNWPARQEGWWKLGKASLPETHEWKRLLHWNSSESKVYVSRQQGPEICKNAEDNQAKLQRWSQDSLSYLRKRTV